MLEIVNIGKRFAGQTAIERVNLRIEDGEFFSLLGPSGCGKTTLLRIIAGLETATEGELRLDGRRVDQLPPQKRPFNMVFQRYALFPHLTVAENVAFGLRMHRVPESTRRDRVTKVLDMVGLTTFASRLPETLSGGQQQRVAVARALVNEPKILLLDEPLSALDQKMREHMQTELRALQKRLELTFIYVTHDQDEAFALSDRIGVMNGGHLEQVSTPRELYGRPRTRFTAHFVGSSSRLEGLCAQSVDGGLCEARLKDGTVLRGHAVAPLTPGPIQLFLRPEKGRLCDGSQMKAGANRLQGHVQQSLFRGGGEEIHLAGPWGAVKVIAPAGVLRDDGASAVLEFSPEDLWIFPGDGK